MLGSRSGKGGARALLYRHARFGGAVPWGEYADGSRRVRLRSVREADGRSSVPFGECVSLVVSCERAFENCLKEKQLLVFFFCFFGFPLF